MRKLTLSIALIMGSTLAIADTVQPNDAPNAYINLNSGIAKLYNLPTGEWTGNINAGYSFNPWFALEGGYNIFYGSQLNANVSTNIFDVAVKGTIPFSNIFSLYGRAGIGYGINGWSGTTNQTCGNSIFCDGGLSSNYGLGLVGIGGSFALTQHWDLRLEDTAYIPFSNTYTGTINALTAGVQFNF